MDYISKESYDYIKTKYHPTYKSTDGEGDGFNNGTGQDRFLRVDHHFDESTGMNGDDIKALILEEDKKKLHLSHPERKAHAIRLVLENTRIRCDKRDIFPSINCIDRPIDATLIGAWRNEVFDQIIPENNRKRVQLCNEGIVTIWPDYCHSVPLYESLFTLGFAGILKRSEAARKIGENTAEQEAFFEGIRLTYEAIIDFCKRLASQADSEGNEKMARALRSIAKNAPNSFYEACLTSYIYFMISEHVDGIQVRSLSNFDRELYPFWEADLASGKSLGELKTELAHYLMQYSAIDNYWGQPVYLGGTKADGTTEINELSYAFLDIYDSLGLFNPKIQLKVSYVTTPKKFLLKALDMIRRGHNSIVIVCEETMRRAMLNHGATEVEARLAQLHGCYEYSALGSFGCGMNYLNLLKPLEYALHEGRDGVTKRDAGLKCRPVSEYNSFSELYDEYLRQLKYIIDVTVEIVNGFEDYLYVIDPTSMLSGTFKTCIEKKRDAIGGGASTNDSSIMAGFLADISDSLAMIKKHVFDNGELTLTELVSHLDNNFEGAEWLRKKLLLDSDKFGNNKDLPDGFATEISNYLIKIIRGRKNCAARGGKWKVGFHVARQSYDQAPKTASSPNGRLIGEELSKNCSASMGQNREGATAAILSTTKIDTSLIIGDVPLDLGLLPTAVAGEDGLEAMYGLIQTFMKRGGHAIHINVFSAEKLRAAQAEPEKYRDLQIRVCGWNVLWNNICKVEQDGFIKQAESLV